VRDAVGQRGVDVFLDSIGDLQTEALGLLGSKAHGVTHSARAGAPRPLPGEAFWPMIEKNITLRGFNLEGSDAQFGRVLGQVSTGWRAAG
jgi:hypothetical protein